MQPDFTSRPGEFDHAAPIVFWEGAGLEDLLSCIDRLEEELSSDQGEGGRSEEQANIRVDPGEPHAAGMAAPWEAWLQEQTWSMLGGLLWRARQLDAEDSPGEALRAVERLIELSRFESRLGMCQARDCLHYLVKVWTWEIHEAATELAGMQVQDRAQRAVALDGEAGLHRRARLVSRIGLFLRLDLPRPN